MRVIGFSCCLYRDILFHQDDYVIYGNLTSEEKPIGWMVYVAGGNITNDKMTRLDAFWEIEYGYITGYILPVADLAIEPLELRKYITFDMLKSLCTDQSITSKRVYVGLAV